MARSVTPKRPASRATRKVAIRAVVFQEDDWLYAQCLEYDIAAQARTLESLTHELQRIILGHMAICEENGLEPFRNLPRAPQKFWDMFERSKIPLPAQKTGFEVKRRGFKLLPLQLRVAAA